MGKVLYLTDNTCIEAEVAPGASLLEGAIMADVPWIKSECGGAAACGACLIAIDEAWVGKLDPPKLLEAAMIEAAESPAPHLRLSCQAVMPSGVDGLIVHCVSEEW